MGVSVILPPKPLGHLVSIPRVVTYTGISIRTVRRLIEEWEIPVHEIGRSYFLTRDAVVELKKRWDEAERTAGGNRKSSFQWRRAKVGPRIKSKVRG